MRPIDADALIEILAEMQGRCATKAALVQNSKIWQQVKAMPTVDAQPIRHGHVRFIVNTRTESLKVGCSLCGYEYKSKIGDIHKYCPCCGAKMDGEEK